MDYTVIIEPEADGGYTVSVPALPGCFSQGETLKEAKQNIREAIVCHLECLNSQCKPIPIEESPLSVHVERVSVKIPE